MTIRSNLWTIGLCASALLMSPGAFAIPAPSAPVEVADVLCMNGECVSGESGSGRVVDPSFWIAPTFADYKFLIFEGSVLSDVVYWDGWALWQFASDIDGVPFVDPFPGTVLGTFQETGGPIDLSAAALTVCPTLNCNSVLAGVGGGTVAPTVTFTSDAEVPEPASLALLGLGLAGLGASRRKKA